MRQPRRRQIRSSSRVGGRRGAKTAKSRGLYPGFLETFILNIGNGEFMERTGYGVKLTLNRAASFERIGGDGTGSSQVE